MKTNLPSPQTEDSAAGTKLYFNNYGTTPVTFSANDFAAALGFFESKGFDRDAAITTASVVLDQAKVDQIPVTQLLDSLKGFNSLELSGLVAEILNNNRPSTSSLGYRDPNVSVSSQVRNISA
jgi:hypothetical protein